MAKKIRKLKTSYINKNSGKEISHTISKIKEHEMKYTIILVVLFMILITTSIYLVICVRPSYYLNYESPNLTFSSEVIILDNKDILSDEDGLGSYEHEIYFSNNTDDNINYIIRIVNDEDKIEECNCSSDIVGYKSIKYSINDGEVMSFNDNEMIIDTGIIEANRSDTITIRFWLDENTYRNKDNYFYGKIIFEQYEDMDEED